MQQTINARPTWFSNERPALLDRLSRQLVYRLFSALKIGHLTVISPEGTDHFGDTASDFRATMCIKNPSVYRAIALGGSIAAGETYFDEHWSTPDLVQLLRLFVKNLSVSHQMERGMARIFSGLLHLIYRVSQKNTTGRARKHIAAHYDIGNEMFELFLDDTMMYSSAIYPSADATLHQAQLYRLDRIGKKLQLTDKDHVLEIGTGWGALAIHLAKTYGCRVTSITLSIEQQTKAIERVKSEGMENLVTVLLKDYRELTGHYDKLVSIEMIEAVGHQYFDEYFRCCGRLLKHNGLMLIQAILIDDRRYEGAKNEVDYIKRHIFPGGCLPSLNVISTSIRTQTDLSMVHVEEITPHYARTLHDWRQRFLANRETLNALGYDDTFIRKWEYYFAYCEAGFTERSIRTDQIMFAKPGCRQDSLISI